MYPSVGNIYNFNVISKLYTHNHALSQQTLRMFDLDIYIYVSLSCVDKVILHLRLHTGFKKTHYEVLELSRTATPSEIKAAFVRLSKRVRF